MSTAGFHLTHLGPGNALLEPTHGMDVGHPEELLEEIVRRLQERRATLLYYDLSEMPLIDTVYYGWLNRLALACKSINVRMVCISMQPTAAFALAGLTDTPPRFESALDLAGR
jgi:Anti-anti-sigma regulatory factor (antagonist of anti-sigma factor)